MDYKSQLLASYCHYSSYVRKLEAILQIYPRSSLAEVQFVHEFGRPSGDFASFPWYVDPVEKEQQDIFHNMTEKKFPDSLENYCYVSLGYTSPSKGGQKEISTAPLKMSVQSEFVTYPNPFDKFTLVYEPDLRIKDAQFIIDGKYNVSYHNDCENILLSDALQQSDFMAQLQSMLYMSAEIEHYDDINLTHIETAKANRLLIETYTSVLLRPIENMILNVLGRTAETGKNLLQKIYQKDACLALAEKDHLIPSARRFSDYLNIRHLLHHQADALTCFRYFIANRHYTDDRPEFLTSYSTLCDKPQKDRVSSYVHALNDFRALVQKFYPNLLYRQTTESNSKFVDRIKQYHRENPSHELLLELNYSYKNEKSAKLLRNIHKLFPQATVIDTPEVQQARLQDEIGAYDLLNYFLMKHQDIENYISFYCLTHGTPLQKGKAVNFLQESGIIDTQDAQTLHDLRELRNRLSHHYFTPELAKDLQENTTTFFDTVRKISAKLDEHAPTGIWQHDAVFRFQHKNGKIVDVDFNEKKIVGVFRPQTAEMPQENKREAIPAASKQQTANVRLPDGTKIDYDLQKITFADNAVFYFNSDEHYCLLLRNSDRSQTSKLLLDKDMTVKSCIINGSKISVRRGDTFSAASYMIMLDKQGRLAKYIYNGGSGKRQTVSFAAAGRHLIKSAKGAIFNLSQGQPKVVYNPWLAQQAAQQNKKI